MPEVAENLFRVMTDEALGGCISALESSRWLSNPTTGECMAAIESAFQGAASEQATLFLVFIGHGVHSGEEFYLLPLDADGSGQPTMISAVPLVPFLKQLHKKYTNSEGMLDGLVLLIDACSAGVAALEASAQWLAPLNGTLRFELLTAVTDAAAADGCFSKSFTEAVRKGVPSVALEYLQCVHLRGVIERSCPAQDPQHLFFNSDEGLYIAKNQARSESKERPWGRTSVAVELSG